MNKKKIVTILIVIATVILAGVAVFTAIRLYQLRQQAVAPTAPEKPEAAAPVIEACTQLAFTITATPTPPPGAVVCEGKNAYRDDSRNTAGNYYLTGNGIGANETVAPGETIVFEIDPGPDGITKTISITDSLPSSLSFLDSDSTCSYDSSTRNLTCTLGGTDTQAAFRVVVSENASGTITNTTTVQGEGNEESTCSVNLAVEEGATPTPTPTPSPSPSPTASPVAQASPTPTPEAALPEAGVSYPTIIGAGAGIILILLSLLLAL